MPAPAGAPTENKLVLLDDASGAVLWTMSAPRDETTRDRQIAALELAFSPDGRVLTHGPAGSARVTPLDRASGDFLWSSALASVSPGARRRLRFSADGEFISCDCAEGGVRTLRARDGVVLWRAFAGGWPSLDGLDLTPDGLWLAAGTQRFDAALLRTSDGRLEWHDWPQALALPATTARAGALALPLDARDAALLLSPSPGNDTAQVRGAPGTGGEALMEAHAAP